nr:MAG TPA: hypothetical protein [Caudoviricetes sp.]
MLGIEPSRMDKRKYTKNKPFLSYVSRHPD